MLPSADEIVERGRALRPRPIAIEAFWDGDTEGWFLVLTAIVKGRSARHAELSQIDLACLRDGGDIRLFNHEVPPWPESVLAVEVGEQLARALDVPFHFASRDQPRDECVRWWDRGRGQPCADCAIEILQDPDVPWFGVCYPCHLEREAKRPRVIVEPVHDLARGEFDALRAMLVAGGVGVCTSIAVAVLRDAGRLADVRVRAARTSREHGDLVWPPSADEC